jgi:hypothetical protein
LALQPTGPVPDRPYPSVTRHDSVKPAQCIKLASAKVPGASDAPRSRMVEEHYDGALVIVMLAAVFEQEIDGRRRDTALLGTRRCVSRQVRLHVAPRISW